MPVTKRNNPATAYNVYLGTKHIDTVFQSGTSSADEVRRALIDHDGYDHRIRVTKARRNNPGGTPALVWHEQEHPDGLQYVATAPLGVKYVIWGGSQGGGGSIDRERSLHRPYALRDQRTLGAAKEEAERDAAPYFAHRNNPRREVETEAYFAAMEPTRAKYASRSPEELVLVRSKAAKMLRQYAGKSDREVAKALGLDPRDPAVLYYIASLREHPVVTNPTKRTTKRKTSAKRTGGRTAAQSTAAKAMRLFHSGKASSLAEAWAMLRR
jgi:hypothetical protein